MKHALKRPLPLAIASTLLLANVAAQAGDVVRHPLANGNPFPIARAVTVPAGTELIFHSGTTPGAPADPSAAPGTVAYWGDTKTQALSTFKAIQASLTDLGLGFGDVVSMTVYLVADPSSKDGRMDFAGFMESYKLFFGTPEQPNLPSRSTVQVAGLASPGVLVEVEVTLAHKAPAAHGTHKPK